MLVGDTWDDYTLIFKEKDFEIKDQLRYHYIITSYLEKIKEISKDIKIVFINGLSKNESYYKLIFPNSELALLFKLIYL